ncbi:Actin-fragmin kinase [Diplonema papillatum]|nr:Actin-fragmin kinase [Diplonema papillatum]
MATFDAVAMGKRQRKLQDLSQAKRSCRPPARWSRLQATRSVAGQSEQDDEFSFDYTQWRDAPPPRTKFSLVHYDGKMVVFGGGYQRSFHADLYEYTIATKTWRCVQEDASVLGGPCHRRSHKVVRRGNQMILFGGRLVYQRRSDVYALDLDTYKWKNVTPGAEKGPSPVDRAAHAAVLWRDHMVVFGGDRDSGDGQSHLNDLWQLNLDTYTWKELHPTGDVPSARLGHDCAVSGDTMYLFGGYQGRALNDMYAIDLAVGVWRSVSCDTPFSKVQPTSFLSMGGQLSETPVVRRKRDAATEGSGPEDWPHAPRDVEEDVCSGLFVWGGAYTDKDTYTDNLYRYDVETELFEHVETIGARPTARLGHCLSIVDKQLFLFGGCDSVYYNDMFAIDLSPPSLKEVLRNYILTEGIDYDARTRKVELTTPPRIVGQMKLTKLASRMEGTSAALYGTSPVTPILVGQNKHAFTADGVQALLDGPGFSSVSSSSSSFFDTVDDAESSTNTAPHMLPFSPATTSPLFPSPQSATDGL